MSRTRIHGLTDDKSLTNDSVASGTKKVTKTVQEIRENSKLIAADVASNVKDLEKVGLEFAEWEKSAVGALHMAKGRPQDTADVQHRRPNSWCVKDVYKFYKDDNNR